MSLAIDTHWGMFMTAAAVVNDLPLPLTGDDAELQALTIAMILESELGIRLTDSELTAEMLGDRGSVLALLARHGIR